MTTKTDYSRLPARHKSQIGMQVLRKTVEGFKFPPELEERRQHLLRLVDLDSQEPSNFGLRIFDLCDQDREANWDYFADGPVAVHEQTSLGLLVDQVVAGGRINTEKFPQGHPGYSVARGLWHYQAQMADTQ